MLLVENQMSLVWAMDDDLMSSSPSLFSFTYYLGYRVLFHRCPFRYLKMVTLTPYCALDKAHVVQVGAGNGMNRGGGSGQR